MGVISACLPVYRPLFGRRKEPPQTEYSGYTAKASDKSRSIPLSDRSEGFDGWSTVSIVQGPSDDMEARPFVKLSDPEAIHRDASFTFARERVVQ